MLTEKEAKELIDKKDVRVRFLAGKLYNITIPGRAVISKEINDEVVAKVVEIQNNPAFVHFIRTSINKV
jgi:hypothetical protein